jgi:hypothetical protein
MEPVVGNLNKMSTTAAENSATIIVRRWRGVEMRVVRVLPVALAFNVKKLYMLFCVIYVGTVIR